MTYREYTVEQYDEVMRLLKTNIPLNEISRLTNVGVCAVRRYKQGHKPKSITRIPMNEDFFNEWSREMSYTLGFLYADGHIYHSTGYRVAFTQKDKNYLKKIKVLLKSQHKIRKNKHTNGHVLEIHCKKMYSDLLKFGLTPNKHATMTFPDVPDKFLFDFVRGYFDGDGYIWFYKYKNVNHTCVRIGLSSSSKDFIIPLKKELEKRGVFPMLVIEKNNKSNNLHYSIRLESKKARDFLTLIYKNSTPLTRMDRKYNRYIQAIKEKPKEALQRC